MGLLIKEFTTLYTRLSTEFVDNHIKMKKVKKPPEQADHEFLVKSVNRVCN